MAAPAYSLVAVGIFMWWLLLLRSTGSKVRTSIVAVHRLGCFAACGVFSDQGSNPCLPHWQADSLPLSHQGSPTQKLVGSSICNRDKARAASVKWWDEVSRSHPLSFSPYPSWCTPNPCPPRRHLPRAPQKSVQNTLAQRVSDGPSSSGF